METPKEPLPLVIVVPLVGAGVLALWGGVTRDASAGVEAGFLALLVAGVGAVIAVLAPRPGWETVGGTLAAVLAGLAVAPGPLRGASVAALLALAFTAAAARAVSRSLGLSGEPVDLRRALATLIPVAIGLQLLARGGVLLDPPGLLRTGVVVVALPVAAAVALAELARGVGGVRALAVGGALFALGGGWWPGTVLAVGVLACAADLRVGRLLRGVIAIALLGLLTLLATRLGVTALAVGLGVLLLPGRAWITSSLGVVAILVALLSGYPWLRTQPLHSLAAAPAALFSRGESLLADGPPLRLDATTASFRHELAVPRRVARVVLDSTLVRAAGLAAGTPVATVVVAGADGEENELPLRVGTETGEWAARRPGMSAAAPEPTLAWIDAGRFFGQRYRARWDVPSPRTIVRIEVRRRPDLPAEVELHLFRLELVP